MEGNYALILHLCTEDIAPFQSLQPFMLKDDLDTGARISLDIPEANTNMIQFVMKALIELKNFESNENLYAARRMAIREFRETSEQIYLNWLSTLIASERWAWQNDFAVFYRVVNEKYIVYAFYTVMLQEFSKEGHKIQCLIPCPSLLEEDYHPNLSLPDHQTEEEIHDHDHQQQHPLLERFRKFLGMTSHYVGDHNALISNCLISVNTVLKPTAGQWCGVYNNSNDVEAAPYAFYTGYNAVHTYNKTMVRFVQHFFGIEDKLEAQWLVNEILSLGDHYEANTAHCLQICIPMDQVEQFVFACGSYGRPYDLRYDPKDDSYSAYLLGNAPRVSYKSVPIGMRTLLRTPAIGDVQARILAHPSLWLQHKAITKVLHSNPFFKADELLSQIRTLLSPYIASAHTRGQQLGLNGTLVYEKSTQ